MDALCYESVAKSPNRLNGYMVAVHFLKIAVKRY